MFDRSKLINLVPLIAALLFIALFVRLGLWQLDRAQQKVDLQQAFDTPGSYAQVTGSLSPPQYQAIEAEGRYWVAQQILVDNVIQDGRLGYAVITPLELNSRDPLLLINRGWTPKQPGTASTPDVSLPDTRHRLRGKAGHLPRVGIRPGEAFAEPKAWPRVGVWPTYDEIAFELGRDVLPYVLLLDPDQENGFVRRWQPQQSGPSTHYGYAFQWFAMATAVLALLGWHTAKRRKRPVTDDK